jgi:small subunit ribosomal protein S8
VYVPSDKLPRVRNGLGTAVISTSQGVMSDKQARKNNVGGEILLTVW